MQPFPLLLRCSTFWSMTLCFIYPTMAQVPNEVINSIGMKFVKIPKGTFTMGAPETELGFGRDEAQHEVTISKDFYLGVFEVTQSEYSKLMEKNPSQNRYPGRFDSVDTDELPVEQVSWEDAVEFCSRLSESPEEKKESRLYRLPTEAEWEYACRAGSKTAYSFGDDPELLPSHGWYAKNKYQSTREVGILPPNRWGLYDMHGNVAEWCSDWYAEYPKLPVTDPIGPSEGTFRILRGGSVLGAPATCRSACRYGLPPKDCFSANLGFRVVLNAPAAPADALPKCQPDSGLSQSR